jgi:uncharacterized protein (DUF433 family)
MAKDYIEKRETGYYVIGSRIPLDTIVIAFLNGESAEGIVESFPALTLEQVYGAIAFYLANRAIVDKYLEEGEREYERLREESRTKNPVFHERLRSILEGKRAVKP